MTTMVAELTQCALTLEEIANVLRAVNRQGCASICDAQAKRAREALLTNPRVKYPIERLKVGESLTIDNPRQHLRGSLYNRAEMLGIKISVRQDGNGGLTVRRAA